jgi:DNA/RNA-binding domain of Phe-tRNA-synthetase-like protein
MAPRLEIAASLDPCPCRPALIWAEDLAPPAPSGELPEALADLVARAREQGEALWPPERKRGVRDMLRHGKYKPSGRSKPASEFLLQAAQKDRFPAVLPPVDCNNFVSLGSGLPGTLFDTDRFGEHLILRRGRPGERYVFNPSGQEIDLQDLLLLARPARPPTDAGPEEPAAASSEGVPCGNPVKDSMATKVQPGKTRRVVAVLYAPVDEPTDRLTRWAEKYAELLGDWCGAARIGVEIHPA